MPLYEYLCETCNETFEIIQKFADEPLQTHANCGGKVHRLLSPPALQFKGSGWYVTDYGRKNGSGSSPSKPSPAADTSSKSDTTAKPSATTTEKK
jgi:putative FmdB family regulatory protein